MKRSFLVLLAATFAIALATTALAQVKVNFTLNTTDAYGNALVQSRYYWVYRPAGLSTSTPVPMLIIFEDTPNGSPKNFFNTKANQMGVVVVSCSFSGNSTGTPGTVWVNDNPRIVGWEDYDCTDAVIAAVRASDNCNDVFITGVSKGGHMSYAYACERPAMLKAAAPMGEFMQLLTNLPTAPVPVIIFMGTADANVPYPMVKDSCDALLAFNGLSGVTPVTTYESSPLIPGNATQATWRGVVNGTQIALVTIIGGQHSVPTSGIQTGYSSPDGLWAFCSQFLTSTQAAVKIVSPPVANVQVAGQPATFWVAATGNTTLTYQWRKNGTNIPGATANYYTTPPVAAADNNALFSCAVTNGSGTVISTTGKLTVNAAPAGPAITAHPASQSVVAGQLVTFSVAATGTGTLTYQWQKNGVNIVGATNASLPIPAAITPDSDAAFRVNVTDSTGTATSIRATLTVTPAPWAPVIVANVARQRVLVGQTANFSIGVKRNATSYQWQKAILVTSGPLAGTTNMADIPGATGATYTVTSPALTDHLTLLRCIAANSAGNATSASEFLFVTTTVKSPTDITSPSTATAQVNVPFSYAIGSSGGTLPITYSAAPLPAGLSVNASTGVISGTPAATGMTNITIGGSNSAGTNSGPLVLTVTNTPVPVPFTDWRSANFGAQALNPAIAGDLIDTDGDGVTNLFEYATGTDPFAPDLLPWSYAVAGGYLTAAVGKNPTATGVTWSAESSADLSIWHAADTTVLQNTSSLFQARDNFPDSANLRRFLRLKVTRP